MKALIGIVLAASTLSAGFIPTAHAQEASETRNIDARVTRVMLDGVINLRIRQGSTPSLTIYADRQHLQQITSKQDADTLVINSDIHNRGLSRAERNAIRAELTLPSLRELNARGVGSSNVEGFSGDDLQVALNGTGSISVASQYKRMVARLTGVGNISLAGADAERIEINLPGAGSISAAGRAKELSAEVSGVGSLDARALTVDNLKLGLHGVGGATVTAKQVANIDLSGIGSATIYGQPVTRNVNTGGLGKAIWK